ncbi:hypothetical protein AJ78_05014 [Emergomyces pasteurianus Ep9510]|uniref:Uncharacterized protein n=1 Tax=Emergomyces pasteurianus Ep9510 TaxID=1447872 RepID=A0A1J9QHI2_9EURO|nr:hypothetical protein AJ78_05014 [Emergomyces pasteurianus Ep9510]
MPGKGKKRPVKRNASSSTEISRRFLSKHERLLRRFYEPLVLLHTLGPTRGAHTSPVPLSPRRSFLNELAYVCDYDKGGDTVTAIGLESTPQGCTFWVASNTWAAAKMIVPFLNILLQTLKFIANSPVSGDRDSGRIVELCVAFGARRIKKYKLLLSRELQGCSEHFKANKNTLSGLEEWLGGFCDSDPNDLVYLCQLAFERRKSPEMKLLDELSEEPPYKTSKDAIHHKFSQLRHYIGRLAHHIRAVNTLVSNASKLSHLFDGYSIRAVATPERADRLPQIDEAAVSDKTLLDKVLVRMLPAKSPDLGIYQQKLRKLDETTGSFFSRFVAPYKSPNIRPRVHAEIQVLELFHTKQFRFEGSDRYIACSKPACYCCRLYFRHHPGKFEEPRSHCKIYLNWGPPDGNIMVDSGGPNGRANGAEDNEGQIRQRNILNAMIKDIREDAFYEIEGKQGRSRWHPDSSTGITSTPARQTQSTVEGSEWGEEIGIYDGGLSTWDNGSRASSATLSAVTQKIPESVMASNYTWVGVKGGLDIDRIPFSTDDNTIASTIASQTQLFGGGSCSSTTGPFSSASISSALGSLLESSNSEDEEEDLDEDGGVPLSD